MKNNNSVLLDLIIHVKSHRWMLVFFIILTMGAACISFQYVMGSQGKIPFFYEIFLDQTNGILDICLVSPFIWMLVTGNPSSPALCDHYSPRIIVRNLLTINLLCIVLYVIINLLVYGLFSNFKYPFIDYWIADNQIYRMGISPIGACGISLILIFTRMTFFSMLSYTVNKKTNSQYLGFIAVIIICLLDWNLYEWAKIYEPLGILPIEHSRIVYTEGYAPMADTDSRLPFIVSVAYWLILYTLVILILFNSKKHVKRGVKNENC